MDDLTIYIDELLIDGSVSPDHDGLAIAIRERSGGTLDSPTASAVSRAVARSLSPISPIPGSEGSGA